MSKGSIEQMVQDVAAGFAGIDRISVEFADRLSEILDRSNNEALLLLYRNRVKFCWLVAAQILEQRGVVLPEEGGA